MIARSIATSVNDIETSGIRISGEEPANINKEGCIAGSGKKETENRYIPSFNAIKIYGAYQLNIKLQKRQNVEITGDDNILSHITTKVVEATLFISSNASFCTKKPLDINISIENIRLLNSDGAIDIFVYDILNNIFRLNLEGASIAHVSGSTSKFIAKISGAGDLFAESLRAKDVNISINGAGDAFVYVSGTLYVNIDGVGNVTYYGSPKEILKELSGVGNLENGN